MDKINITLRLFKDKDGKVCEVYAPVSDKVIELTKDQYKVHEDDKNK